MSRRWIGLNVVAVILAVTGPAWARRPGAMDTSRSPRAALRSVGMDEVRWTEGFWGEKFELCRRATIPSIYESLLNAENAAYLPNFDVAAGRKEGRHIGTNWGDGDCYKWIEAAAHVYAVTRDEALDRLMDRWIDAIAAAQAEDGYISTNIQLTGRPRLANPHHHEIYNMGHLLNAACIHYRATGKRNFLDVAVKLGDYLYKTFQPRPPELAHFGWNPSNIMGLAELYRTTGDGRYLELTRTFVDMRGSAGGTDLTQDRVPLRAESEAVGHCVCAAYLYCGAADLCAETGDGALRDALERIWANITGRRMYITGGIGSFWHGTSTRGDAVHEAFGGDYELPGRTAYCETCANIGNAMFNQRMLTLSGEGRFGDVAERVMYNSMLSAWSADGRRFFYANPLARDGRNEGLSKHHTAERWVIHTCYCCPPQVARTIAKLDNWFYSVSDEGVWINHFGSSTLKTQLPNGETIALTQETEYPWQGDIKITVERGGSFAWGVMLRIPGWTDQYRVRINGKDVEGTAAAGYLKLNRRWSEGDRIELGLAMEPRLMRAHPAAAGLHGHVAVMRGPVVYCLELPEGPGGTDKWNDGVFLPENIRLTPCWDETLAGGVMTLKGKALTRAGKVRFVEEPASVAVSEDVTPPKDVLYYPFKGRDLPEPETGLVEITLIPYYAWANRGPACMAVWLPLAR